jgi:ubiquitin carboxyl-terminal hydrolase 1
MFDISYFEKFKCMFYFYKIASFSNFFLDSGLQNGNCTNGVEYEEDQANIGHNFISEHFEGVSLLRTTCLECEQVTQRKETFCDICVPITTDLQLKGRTE